jgi:hypothetical protein
MTYEEWIKKSNELNANVDLAHDELHKIIGDLKSASGLVSDEVRATPEFKEAKKNYDLAFNAYRVFNQSSPKEYMQRKSQEHRAKKIAENRR